MASVPVRPLGRTLAAALLALIVLAGLLPDAEARKRDRDNDGLSNRFERKKSHTNPRRADTDGDKLRDRFELRRSKTNPRRRDTDRDGLSDGAEVRRFKTNPRRRDTDRDGLSDGAEVRRYKTNPRRRDSDGDGVPDGVEVRRAKARPAPAPAPPAAPLWTCNLNVSSASALRSAVQGNPGTTVCVQGAVGDVDLSRVRPSAAVTIAPATGGGSLGELNMKSTANVQVLGLRFESVLIIGDSSAPAQNLAFRLCVAGGTGPDARADVFALFNVREHVNGLTVENCDLGWTTSVGASGDKGFGFRLVNGQAGPIRNVTLRANRLHNLACDALQLSGPENLTFDRNEISYVASDGVDLHADSIQVLDVGPGARFTNNYIHHTGFLAPGQIPAGGAAGQWIWHNYSDTGGLVENNLMVQNRNYTPAWGGSPAITMRRNTIVDNGLAFGGGGDMQWGPEAGGGRSAEANIIGASGTLSNVSRSGNVFIDQNGSGSDIRWGVRFDANWNPTNLPASHAGAGYRKPSGVPW